MSRDLAVEYVPTAELRTYHRNPRHGDTKKIAESLTVNGQYRAIAINRGTHTGRANEVLAGNHTLLAARDLGWETIAATFVDVDDDQAARIVLADNRTAELAGYDERLLAELLADLPDLDGTGYDPGDLEALAKGLLDDDAPPAGLNDPDDAPTLLDDPISQTGDVWELGPHRLVVGDALDPLVWETLLDGELADAMWTDPPYGVSYVGKTADALTLQNDANSGAEMASFLRAAFAVALVSCKQGAAWYVSSTPAAQMIEFASVLAGLGVLRQTLVWVKDVFVLGHMDYHARFEPIFYGWTPGAAHHPPPDRTQDSVHEIDRPKRSTEHPTIKPVALVALHLGNSTDRGDVVVDPFAGSGTTAIACHQLGRAARLIEVDPRYADVILRRFQEHTGTVPTRDGHPHDFTAEA